MKLERLMSGACAAAVVASLLACGCSSSSSASTKSAADQAALDGRTATTELMSAQVEGPAPKVGKSHAVGSAADEADELTAPKDARPSDGSHRAGNFGSAK